MGEYLYDANPAQTKPLEVDPNKNNSSIHSTNKLELANSIKSCNNSIKLISSSSSSSNSCKGVREQAANQDSKIKPTLGCVECASSWLKDRNQTANRFIHIYSNRKASTTQRVP